MNRAERNALVLEHLPLVGYLVNDAMRRATHLSREDLTSVATLALIHAVDAFDPTLGVPLGAYARQRITGAIADDMRSTDWATRAVRSRIRETTAAQDQLTRSLGRHPDRDELAAAMGVDRATVNATLAAATHIVQPLDDEVVDTLAAEEVSPADQVLVAEQAAMVRAGVSLLPERMRYVVEQIYFHDRSVNDIAAELGISHAAVSQHRSAAVAMLREAMDTHYGDADTAAAEPSAGPARKRAYLAGFADATAGGLTRKPGLSEAA